MKTKPRKSFLNVLIGLKQIMSQLKIERRESRMSHSILIVMALAVLTLIPIVILYTPFRKGIAESDLWLAIVFFEGIFFYFFLILYLRVRITKLRDQKNHGKLVKCIVIFPLLTVAIVYCLDIFDARIFIAGMLMSYMAYRSRAKL